MTELALFPLKSVLLPGNKLTLKIFETRYIDMIAKCMREDQEFGVILIYNGEETDSNSEIFSIGTSAKVTDWQDRDDGLLGITATGLKRFQIHSTSIRHDGLIIADIEYLDDDIEQTIPDQFFYMTELLRHISPHSHENFADLGFNATVYQLIYLLPLDNTLKQKLLEVSGNLDRAVVLHAELIRLGVIQYIKP